jgi:pimeloyl-ACP methyl ester carboxylesterase
MRNASRTAAVVVAALAAASCSVPVRTDRVGADEVYATVKKDVLLGGEPSVAARLVLERAGLQEQWDADRAAAIVTLHQMAEQEDTRERLFGLAELCLYQGERTGGRKWFLGSSVYAYLYLFGKADAPPPGPFDPRFRTACDIYDRGISEAFRNLENNEFHPDGGKLPLPVGTIDVAVPADTVKIGDVVFDQFISADDFAVEGMRARVRTEGLGLPLIARRRNIPENEELSTQVGRMSPRVSVAMTAVLTIDGEFDDLEQGKARGTLAIRVPRDSATVDVRGQKVPLTNDITTPIAYGLGKSKLWSFSLNAFLSGGDEPIKNGLLLVAPYQKGKIPLVLVHGTASSPATWAELVNEIAADREIASHYQLWLFIYRTGVPILVSAASLRDTLHATMQAIDPEGKDEALRRMVVVGHSQGGLLTQLMVTSSGDRFWKNISDEPFASMDLEDKERETLKNVFFFEPVPQVERVVFISTPHKGSFLAEGILGKIGSSLVSLPQTLVHETEGAVTRNFARLKGDKIGSLPTAVDNMKAGSSFLEALAACPIESGVEVNSIVAVQGDGPVEEGDDGVVAYESAHWPTAESEIVVKSDHSCQGNPKTIIEIRRILHKHLRTKPAPRPGLTATPAPQPAPAPAAAPAK